MDRSERRAQEEKHKAKIRRLFKETMHNEDLANNEKFIGKMEHVHGKPCSCPMCSPIKHGNSKNRMTVQEKRFTESEASSASLDCLSH